MEFPWLDKNKNVLDTVTARNLGHFFRIALDQYDAI
jgi:hypothetical protein